jgi:CheY-like chemotaxis protein
VLGYESEDVGSGAEALALARAQPGRFDAVLLDMTMPGMTGRETFMALREIEPELRVLLMSGFALNDEARQLLELGVQGFLPKPFGLSRLSEAVAELLAGPDQGTIE